MSIRESIVEHEEKKRCHRIREYFLSYIIKTHTTRVIIISRLWDSALRGLCVVVVSYFRGGNVLNTHRRHKSRSK
jgi:hypothetical protein